MAHYFTRDEAEALLPQISIGLLQIQQNRKALLENEEALTCSVYRQWAMDTTCINAS